MFATKPAVLGDVQRETGERPVRAARAVVPELERVGPYAVLGDESATARVVRELISASGMSTGRVARRMGIHPCTLQKYLNTQGVQKQWRTTSVKQLARIATVCGGRLILEFPREPLG